MTDDPVYLTLEQQQFIQRVIPSLCNHGKWTLRACSAGGDHVHVLLDADRAVDGNTIRRILKRWVTQAIEELWRKPAGGSWWARQGSNRPVTREPYLNNAFKYIENQRAT